MSDMYKLNLLEKEFLSVKEFACLVGVHYNTVLRAIQSGKLHAFRINTSTKSSYRIARCEIHRIALFDMQDIIERILEEKMK